MPHIYQRQVKEYFFYIGTFIEININIKERYFLQGN